MNCLQAIVRTVLMSALLGFGPLLTPQPEPNVQQIPFTPRANAAPGTPMTVTFGERSLTFTGVMPGEQVAVFGLTREPLGKHPMTPTTVVRAEILTDTDRDGVVRFDLPVEIPLQGMWAAVGLSSGAHAAFPTPGYKAQLIQLVPDLVRSDNTGQLNKLEWTFSEIDLFVVRPGEGAWRRYTSKGSGLDENKDNGKRALRMDVSSMTRIGGSPEGPRKLRNGDIVAVFDRHEMRYGILEVGR